VPPFVPSAVGEVVLRAADLDRQEAFYGGAVGLATSRDDGVLTVTDPAGEPLVRLDARETAGAPPPPRGHTGLFHTALRFPTREELGAALLHVVQAGHRLTGASDHGVSEALYLNDPEHNGVELYWDRPFEEWPLNADGTVAMFTAPLDVTAIARAGQAVGAEGPPPADVGHVHLKVSDIRRSLEFYVGVLGLRDRASWGEAGFLAVGDYHHHVGMNVWESRGGSPAPPGTTGLDRFELRLPDAAAAAERARAAGRPVEELDGLPVVRDPDDIRVILRP
jgi:catechol 2,3-dioxygenase